VVALAIVTLHPEGSTPKRENLVHPLDNPIWSALTTQQSSIAIGGDLARRFPADKAPFGAFPSPSKESFDSLAQLCEEGNETALFTLGPVDLPGRFEVTRSAVLNQMICTPVQMHEPTVELTQLGSNDVDAMMALVDLTKPGPFAIRTHELGRYVGIRVDGQLVAMAGERLHVDGFTQVSAVCTHPLHRGRGYSRDLIAGVSKGIQARGEVPFLHVLDDNLSAIALYEKLGFTFRSALQLTVVTRVS
jgi:ribosomal protein S18 acetylase RimI-like enzyme